MAKMMKKDRRGVGLLFLVGVAVVTFLLYSAAIAWSTINDCDQYADKDWQIFPPEWECKGNQGFG
jgi:hypothetical protein